MYCSDSWVAHIFQEYMDWGSKYHNNRTAQTTATCEVTVCPYRISVYALYSMLIKDKLGCQNPNLIMC